MRELKFQSVHRSFKDGRIEFHQWGPEYRDGMPRGFSCPPSVTGMELIALRQSTGLKDKNGKEIYEGDIIKVKDCEQVAMNCDGEEVMEDVTGKVIFEGAGFVFTGHTLGVIPIIYPDADDIEILSNIYQKNPELL